MGFPHEQFIGALPAGFLEQRGAGGVAVDCGAFIGDHASQFVSLGFNTYAVEPFYDAFVCLCYNSPASRNILGAVGDGRCVRRIHTYPGTNHGMRSVTEDPKGEATIRIDDWKLPRLDLLKIDVEGCEQWVLDGARETVTRCHPVLIVESYNDVLLKHGSNSEMLEKTLRGLGCTLVKKGDGVKFDWVCHWS